MSLGHAAQASGSSLGGKRFLARLLFGTTDSLTCTFDELRGRLSALGFWPFRPDGRGMNGGVQGCPSLADDACSSAWPARHADPRLGVLNERVEAAEVALRGRVGLERSVARYVANVLVSVVEVDGFPASTMVDPCII